MARPLKYDTAGVDVVIVEVAEGRVERGILVDMFFLSKLVAPEVRRHEKAGAPDGAPAWGGFGVAECYSVAWLPRTRRNALSPAAGTVHSTGSPTGANGVVPRSWVISGCRLSLKFPASGWIRSWPRLRSAAARRHNHRPRRFFLFSAHCSLLTAHCSLLTRHFVLPPSYLKFKTTPTMVK